MITTNQYSPQTVSHPGQTLLAKLEEIEISSKEFALKIQTSVKTISSILAGEGAITPDMAILFEEALNIPASFWLKRQQRYNEAIARH